MTSEAKMRREIVAYGRMLHERGFIAATDGNLSVRLDDNTLLVTPAGMCKGWMKPEDLVLVDMRGAKKSGERPVSSEVGMHLLIYGLRPEVRAVVHAHPVTATGFAAAGLALEDPLVSEVVISLGRVPLAPFAIPGTPDLAEALRPLVPGHDAILMANHGVVTCGDSLLTAYMRMETVEHFARIALVTRQLGRQRLLNQDQVEKLAAVRERYLKSSEAAPEPVLSRRANH